MAGLFLIDRGRASKDDRSSFARSAQDLPPLTGTGPGKCLPPRSGRHLPARAFLGTIFAEQVRSDRSPPRFELYAPKGLLPAGQGRFQGRKSLPGGQYSRKYAIDTGMGANIISQYRFGF